MTIIGIAACANLAGCAIDSWSRGKAGALAALIERVDMLKIAMFGTFDIANFGDILFPIVTEHMFRRTGRAVELRRYSYRAKSAADWHYDVRPIEAFESDIADTNLVLVGGGHLIHANAFMAPGYGPTSADLPHPFAFWWLPAVAGRMAGIPVALHAPSVEASYPDWSKPLFEGFAQSAHYASARDRLSCERLTSFGAHDVEHVPDSIFSISEMITRGEPSVAFSSLRQRYEMARPYLIVQPSAALRSDRTEIDRLIAAAQAKQWDVVELPIFQEKLNRAGIFANIPGVKMIDSSPDPMLLAEIIANAQGVVGISLHLSIVALSFGVPVYRKRYSASSKFILLDELAAGIGFFDQRPELRDLAGIPEPAIGQFQTKLRAHYEKLISLGSSVSDDRRARGFEMLKRLPEALRQQQSVGERAAEYRLMARRARNFMAARLSVPIDRVTSVLR